MASRRSLSSLRKMLELHPGVTNGRSAWTPKAVLRGDGLGVTGSAFVVSREREDGAHVTDN